MKTAVKVFKEAKAEKKRISNNINWLGSISEDLLGGVNEI